jgi:hypothetical protein
MTIQAIILIINRKLRGIKDLQLPFLIYNTNGVAVHSRDSGLHSRPPMASWSSSDPQRKYRAISLN